MKRTGRVLASVLGIALLVFAGGWLYMKTAMGGFSARAEPSHMEAMMAGYARATAMPASGRRMKNPVAPSPEVLHESMAHFADHCAVCHANDGSGDSMYGRGMYPRPPDLRAARTQGLTDGEIFYDIENGIRMSGMPAFGGPETAEESWKLVHFIRHLPNLTPAEQEDMEALNPKSPAEFKEDEAEDQFLKGCDPPTASATADAVKGGQR